jgi:uncharacterized protein YdeI (YjbR/CyaY-like superfamily)
MKLSNLDTRVDAYIARAADFAKPILEHLRQVVHEGCPGVQETIKWGVPHFEYKGNILCGIAAFKQHCAFGFWLGANLSDPDKILNKVGATSMGNLGPLKTLKDLPPKKILKKYIKEAMVLGETGVKKEPKKLENAVAKNIKVPPYFLSALKKNKQALAAFKDLSISRRKEYIEWITGAKTEDTRNKRMATSITWLSEGKSLNWKYEKK